MNPVPLSLSRRQLVQALMALAFGLSAASTPSAHPVAAQDGLRRAHLSIVEVEMPKVANAMAAFVGRQIECDACSSARVTVVSERAVSGEEALELFRAALHVAGRDLIESDDGRSLRIIGR